ncbi:WecB/TagA/CpsF family glycosyltransferase [Arsenicicoccus bolidensis]|uniref:WecB/TagA/CpsF family glycosyltransferase n=1 Tax=Arsenicicoccus bolidensis TaxID=229480 RepID=A0ABS9PY34_9MICO|nr:WecB/TagA/CpsF family glycosyltransferase [Arsenicicoccus bolidensis]MCG7320535.1 WecB/TagA/CpsF family glycosyltransferase [Arsenicicoccus bolidensis]
MQQLLMGGVQVDAGSEQEVLDLYRGALRGEGGPLAIESANLDHLHWYPTGSHDRSVAGSAAGSVEGGLRWLTLMDGAPFVITAQRLTGVTYPRLTGAGLLEPQLRVAAEEGASVGFLGGMPDMHVRLREELGRRLPDLRIAGTWAPERADITSPEGAARWAETVREAGTDVVVVGLGKPRQEDWIRDHGVASGARALLAYGAAADFIAGTVQRAPQFYQDNHLEWAYRLSREPKRLARRYLLQGPPSLVRLVTHTRPRRRY